MINGVLPSEAKRHAGRWVYLDAMKGVMSNSRGKETYVVIFRRSFAECSNRWGEAGERERDDERRKMERWLMAEQACVWK